MQPPPPRPPDRAPGDRREISYRWQQTVSGGAIGAIIAIAAHLLDASPWWWLAIPIGLWLGASLRLHFAVRFTRK